MNVSIRLALAALAVLSLAAPASAKAPDEFKVFVWKVSNPNIEADAPADYLIGTMHVPVGEGQKLPAELRSLMRTASLVMTEADTSKVTPEMVQKFMFLKGGKSLKQLLPAKSWAKLVKASKPMGVPVAQLSAMEPWFVNVGLTLPAPNGEPVIDDLVQEQAREHNVSLRFLEGAEEQLRIMDSVKQEEDIRQLIETLDHPEQAKQQFEALRKGYFAGDLKAMEALVFDAKQLKSYPDFYEKMLFARTARWAPKVDERFKQEDAILAVGLGHLLGEKGLIALLEKRGYKVEPLAL